MKHIFSRILPGLLCLLLLAGCAKTNDETPEAQTPDTADVQTDETCPSETLPAEISPAETLPAETTASGNSVTVFPEDSYTARFMRIAWMEGNPLAGFLEPQGDPLYGAEIKPVARFESAEDFRQFTGRFQEPDEENDESADRIFWFAEEIPGELADYDEAFFADNALLMIYLEEGSGSFRHEVTGLRIDNDLLTVSVNRMKPEVYTDDMAGWFILVETPKSYLENCAYYAASVTNVPME